MSRIKTLSSILIITGIVLILSMVYIVVFLNNDPSLLNSYVIGIVSGMTSSAIITIVILFFEYRIEKEKYIFDVLMYLTRLSRAIRYERYDIIEDLLWCDSMCCFQSQIPYILNKELFKLITDSRKVILELGDHHAKCTIYKIDFLSEKAKFDEIGKMIDDCRNNLAVFRNKQQKIKQNI